ncbi:hypothetical protein OS493_012206 [Desmophyllum pertusum]|uniref:Uncharacterized protein n=1 Tax=Desmophyllum pertusum TaxID=174260 RepID=A0A9X0DA98_9CNID|nr:hypothetical protein OS493_012206 [Desmophyllum pertusum]
MGSNALGEFISNKNNVTMCASQQLKEVYVRKIYRIMLESNRHNNQTGEDRDTPEVEGCRIASILNACERVAFSISPVVRKKVAADTTSKDEVTVWDEK